MKALSLTQPWATAVALGLKQYETRSWPTAFRGQVIIHAAKGFPRWAKDMAMDFAVRYDFRLTPDFLPLGKLLCVCDLTECRQAETLLPHISEQEAGFGDYAAGRFAFKLESVRILRDPIPARGALSFWPLSRDEAWMVACQLREPA